MPSFRLTISNDQRKALERKLQSAEQLGDLRMIKFVLAIFAVVHYETTEYAARVLNLSEQQVSNYYKQFLIKGCGLLMKVQQVSTRQISERGLMAVTWMLLGIFWAPATQKV